MMRVAFVQAADHFQPVAVIPADVNLLQMDGASAEPRPLARPRRGRSALRSGSAAAGPLRALLSSTRAYMPGNSTPSDSAHEFPPAACGWPGSSEFAVRATVPVNCRPGRFETVSRAAGPRARNWHALRNVYVGAQRGGLRNAEQQRVPAVTSAPESTLRSVITPSKGAFTTR